MDGRGYIQIHLDMWNGLLGEKEDTPTKKFTTLEVGDVTLVTQNLRKHSINTSWVKSDPANKLTWAFRHGRYTGKIRTTMIDGVLTHQIFKLNPEKLTYQETEQERLAAMHKQAG